MGARAMYYLGKSISDQKADMGDDYSQLRKVYSIWFVMEPPKSMSNCIVRHRMVGSYDEGYESLAEIQPCDYAEIVFVYLGKFGDKGKTALGLLNTVFSKDIGREERIRRLKEQFKINIDKSVFEEVDDLMVNLDEDYKKYMARLGREEGMAEGRAEGIQEERARTVGILANNVSTMMMQESISFDEAFKRTSFPEDYREEVRAKVESS